MSKQRLTKPTASLDLIATANGKKTGDELRQEARANRHAALREAHAAEPRPLTANQRKNLRRLMERDGKDILGRPLEQEGDAA